MAGPPRKPSSPTPDWRARARPSDAPRRQKRVLRVLLSAAFLGLAGLFVWLLWPRSWAGVQLAVLPVTGYDIAFPPVPFSYADPSEFAASSPDHRTELLEELQDSANLQRLYDRLQGLVKSPKEVLILYLSAHGVSDGGKPFLLCSDFMREAGGSGATLKVALPGEGSGAEAKGRLPLESVLGQVRLCQAGLKLVLLDCSHIAADPRLGMVVNEFPRLLEGTVKKIDDPSLWVLSCSRPLEVSRVSYAEKRSLFAHFVTQGLRGSADASDEGVVDLAEFYGFVRDGVANAVEQQGGRAETERPMLLHGGEGVVAEPPHHFLFRVRRKTAAEEETPEPAKQEVAAAEKGAAPGKKGAGATPAAPKGFPKAEIRSLLAKAWEWRDKVQAHAGTGNWSPVDYAPQLWREYQQLLLGHEMRYRVGAAWTESSLGELRALAASDAVEGGFGRRTIRGRLAEAERRFAAEEAVARFKSLPEELRIVEESVKLKNELVFAAPYYARWCASAAIVSPDGPTPVDDIAALVGKRLPEFVALLETFEEGNRPASPSAGIQESLKELRDRKEELEKLRTKIDRGGMEQQARLMRQVDTLRQISKFDPAVGDLERKGDVGQIESLLSTPLLAAKSRMALLDALDRVGPLPEAASPAGDSRRRDDTRADQERWDRLARQADLEVQLVRLADPEFAFTAKTKYFSGGRTPQEEVARWEEYRRLGSELQGIYERLPERIHQAVLAKDAGQTRRARRLLPLVDARDVIVDARSAPAKLEEGTSSIVLPLIALPGREKSRLDVTVSKTSVELKRDKTAESVAVRVMYGAGPRVSLKLQYSAGLLEIKDRAGKLSARPDAWEEVSLDPGGERTLVFEVRPRDAARWSPTSLSLQFQTGKEATTRRIDFTLAAEDAVDLVIERIADKAGTRVRQLATGPSGQGGVIACDVFPNRTTAYVFALKNLSHKERKVTVEFWPAGERPRAGRLGGSGAPGTFQPSPDARPLAGPIEVKLPAGETAEPILFQEPKPGEKPEKKASPEGAKSPAEKPKDAAEKPEPGKEPQTPAIEIPYGMVCVIRDPAAGVSWTKWVDFRRVKPAEYLEPQVSYNDAEGKIRVRLKPARDPQRLPLVSAEQPIKVEWTAPEGAEREAAVKPKRPTSELADPGAEDELSAEVARDPNRIVPVWLAVDGYPRAFVYQVPCDRTRDDVPANRDLREIRIRSPKEGDAFASPLAETSPLWVEFQADAPYDAFLEPDEMVEVWLEVKGDPLLAKRTRKSFASDRQWVTRWEGTGPQGMVKIGGKAQDFRVPLATFGLSETKADVHARLVLPEHGVRGKDAKVAIVLDGEPPRILSYSVQSPIAKGADVPVVLEVSDLSGIGRVLFGFVKDDAALLDEKDKLAEIPAAELAEKSRFEFAVPTKEAKPELLPGQKYLLAVRVWDRVGHASQKVAPITIEKMAPAAKAAEMTTTIEGQVYYSRPGNVVDWARLEVRLEKLGRMAKPSDNGQFVFTDVPPGSYTVEATGTAMNTAGLKGSASVNATGGKVRVEVIAKGRD
jgi:hypothetical protein